ncbi:hypothetical protein Celal_1589 [Cellulophaga algicola DSM 14237]|uniref:Uncharacterized protein n=1 Tax=Cellulophaga algicola (strain DSM 14237 / IC166 / ACAM 630) TaxID=688270 RepID=E6XB44_CELAD|nr:hypothetical protein Celal_1589 [Cellulophaga algicola DSM 14237]
MVLIFMYSIIIFKKVHNNLPNVYKLQFSIYKFDVIIKSILSQ